ncbi:hypothetical protein JFL43_03705 [Viridibacillus sp. YIM B01967]|uniref:PIN domain-containing protein n=1 Tax=Viridibacillus soli TaxID=2798301 RepID=A0ABS1H4A4_9BACL|nr:hypothetical protein [Viridibacillus soli]MBK3493977.1 hypothetical protein [Viridibacillus soli]
MTKENVFLDTNIIVAAIRYNKVDIFKMIDAIYATKFVHIEVLKEIRISSEKSFVQGKIDSGDWLLFNPEDSSCLSDDDFDDYEFEVARISKEFSAVDADKNCLNIGEIHSLAAAYINHSELICSHDFSITKVIQSLNLEIYKNGDDTQQPQLIGQHTLFELCRIFMDEYGLKRSEARQFYSAFFVENRTSKNPAKKKKYQKAMEFFDNTFAAKAI